jgi:UDP-N-acetylmuramate: L-alanyl-gamma-D-glutamyl-meso-diaminopimelate ligase
VLVLTSIEHDHVDIYPTEESYLAAFRQLVERVPADGLIVASGADGRVVDVVRSHARAEVAWYALQDSALSGITPHWMAAPAPSAPGTTAFDLFAGGVACGRFVVPMTGRHNLANTLAAVGATAQGYGARLDRIGHALARFDGVKRRQEVVGTPRGITVIDDFAHHPTAVEETLRALRVRYPESRLWVSFEARSATACRRMHQEAYATAFDGADRILLAPLGRDRPEGERLDLDRLVHDLGTRGKVAARFESVHAIVTEIVRGARPGDVVALLSNGAFGGIVPRLVAELAHAPDA